MDKKKILIADDEPLNLILFSQMLKSLGHEMVTVNNGKEAIEIAINEKPDMIILDWNMPKINGLDALIEIKKNNATKDIPVIMITGVMTSPENLRMALDNGAIDFLRKPFDKVELLARVKSVLLLSQSIKMLNEKYQTIEQYANFIQSLIQSIPHPMVYYNLEGEIIDGNNQFEELLGNNIKSLKSYSIYDQCPDNVANKHRQKDCELINNKQKISFEGQAGFENRNYIFSKSLYYDTSGKPKGIMCVMTDVEDLKRAHAEIIDNKKRELASSALKLIHLSELNNKIISDLEKINQYTSGEGRELIRSTIQHFNANSSDKIWQEFETRFENVHESFYRELDNKFPGLTPGERKLSALLRLNLSSKEIATITTQNPQSVDMARYRLRKKMNLSQEENLIDYLAKIGD